MRKYSRIWYVVLVLLAGNVAVFVASQQASGKAFARLTIFDVGQGDGIYLRTLEGNDILIDTGPGDVILGKLGAAMPLFDRTIELVILTHPHADHIAGMVEILKRYQVNEVMLPEVDHDSETYQTLLRRLAEKHINVVHPHLGDRIFLDRSTVFDVLYPVLGKFEHAPDDINDVSIVGRLSFGKMHVMLTGDAGKNIEHFLVQANLPIVSQILKIGHHGSRHSSSQEFLEKTAADFAVISVGAKNSYGHPHPDTLAALTARGEKILRTDQAGDVAFRIYPDRAQWTKR